VVTNFIALALPYPSPPTCLDTQREVCETVCEGRVKKKKKKKKSQAERERERVV
jgi:hypothetical protein